MDKKIFYLLILTFNFIIQFISNYQLSRFLNNLYEFIKETQNEYISQRL